MICFAGSLHIEAIAAGSQHTCAAAGARVWCWGNNDYGQLGIGSQDSQEAPAEVNFNLGAYDEVCNLNLIFFLLAACLGHVLVASMKNTVLFECSLFHSANWSQNVQSNCLDSWICLQL